MDGVAPLTGDQVAQHVLMVIFITSHLSGIIVVATTLWPHYIVLNDGDVQRIGGNSLVGSVVELYTDVQCAGRPIQGALGCHIHRGGQRQDLVGAGCPVLPVHGRARS